MISKKQTKTFVVSTQFARYLVFKLLYLVDGAQLSQNSCTVYIKLSRNFICRISLIVSTETFRASSSQLVTCYGLELLGYLLLIETLRTYMIPLCDPIWILGETVSYSCFTKKYMVLIFALEYLSIRNFFSLQERNNRTHWLELMSGL